MKQQLKLFPNDKQFYLKNPTIHVNADSGVIALNKKLLRFLEIDPAKDKIGFIDFHRGLMFIHKAIKGGMKITPTAFKRKDGKDTWRSFQIKEKALAVKILERYEMGSGAGHLLVDLTPNIILAQKAYSILEKVKKPVQQVQQVQHIKPVKDKLLIYNNLNTNIYTITYDGL